eukprot:6679195-Pyramimonas_sp.AAC.1
MASPPPRGQGDADSEGAGRSARGGAGRGGEQIASHRVAEAFGRAEGAWRAAPRSDKQRGPQVLLGAGLAFAPAVRREAEALPH